MDLALAKARAKAASTTGVTIVAPACALPVEGRKQDTRTLPNDEIDAKFAEAGQEDDEEGTMDDDLLYALNLLSEAEDAISSILKLDKRENILSINHHGDLLQLCQNIAEFNLQFVEDQD